MRVIGSMGCLQCDGTIDIVTENGMDILFDYRDCEHEPAQVEKRVPFSRMVENLSNERLGELLREYVLESEHGNWDGFNAIDLIGISNLFADIAIYAENRKPHDVITNLTVQSALNRIFEVFRIGQKHRLAVTKTIADFGNSESD